MKKFKIWNQEILESDSGKTWYLTIEKAFWDGSFSLGSKLLREAEKLWGRRLNITVKNRGYNFTIPATKFKLKSFKTTERKSNFTNGEPMRFYWYKPTYKQEHKGEKEVVVRKLKTFQPQLLHI